MTRRVLVACVLAVFAAACGGGTNSVDACNQVTSKECDLLFQCLSEADKQAAKDVIGLNSGDCKTKLQANCTEAKTACSSGQTFHEDKAQSCVDAVNKFTCADINSPTITAPAVCGQVCTTS
jgi:hypothetical protein